MVTQRDIEALSPGNLRKMGFSLPEFTEEQIKNIKIPENVKHPEHIRAGRCWIIDLKDKEEP